jgi:hypothetical protein
VEPKFGKAVHADFKRCNITSTLRSVPITPTSSRTSAMYMTCSYPTSSERSFRKDRRQLFRHCQVNLCCTLLTPTCTNSSLDSQLPTHIENYHSLVPLDTKHQKSSTIFGGYSSWIYKAQSSTNGNFVALRRLEGEYTTLEKLTVANDLYQVSA